MGARVWRDLTPLAFLWILVFSLVSTNNRTFGLYFPSLSLSFLGDGSGEKIMGFAVKLGFEVWLWPQFPYP